MANIDFGISAHDSGFKKTANETIDYMRKMSKEADNTQGSVNSMFKEMVKQTAALAGLSLGAAGVKSFATSIVNVRKEMQSLNTSFKVLLGNEDKANAMFGELKQYAATTPLMLKDLANGAQTMLGFNIEAEKVIPTLKAIGDISMGDAQRFQSLSLAFSQMSAAGKLMGQDLLQMINAGFNPLAEISRKTGKSISELKEEMSNGAITANMVSEAFMSATQEGGKFYGMMDKMGQSLKGQLNTLSGAIDDMFNDIGEQSEGAISAVIGGVTTLVQNYETVEGILGTLIATYGTYKAAIVLVTAVEMTNAVGIGMTTKAMWEEVAATKAATVAQRLFNIAAKANPYVLLLTSMVTLAGVMWTFAKNTDEAKDAQKRLNSEVEKFTVKQKEEAEQIKELISVVQDKATTDTQRILAYQKLEERCAALTEKYSMEQLAVASLTDAYKVLNSEQEQQRMMKLAEDTNRKVRAYNEIKKADKRGGVSAETQGFIAKNGLAGMKKEDVLKLLKESIDTQKAELNGYMSAQNKAVADPTKNKAYWEAKKKDAQNRLDVLSDIAAKGKEGEALRKEIAGYDKKLEAYETSKGGAKKDSSEQDLLDYQEELTRKREKEARQGELDITAARVSGMQEGISKTIAQIRLDYEQEQAAIKEHEQELLLQREEEARKLWELQNKDDIDKGKTWSNSGAQAAFRATNTLSQADMDLSVEKDAAATNRYEARMKEQYRRILGEHRSYYDQKLDIEEKYAEKSRVLDALEQSTTDPGKKEEIKRTRQKMMSDKAKEQMTVAMEELKADPAFVEAFEDLNNVSAETLDKLQGRLEELKPILANLPADRLKAITDLMSKISNVKMQRTTKPFKELKIAIEELHRAEESGDPDKVVKAQKKVNDTWKIAKEDVDELAGAIGSLGKELGGEAEEYLSLVSSVMTFVTGSIDSVKMMATTGAQALSTIEKASVILAIIGAAIQIFQKLNQIMNKFSAASQYEKLAERQKEYNKLADAVRSYTYEMLKAQQEEKSWFGESSLNNLANLQEQNVAAYENYYKKLYETQVKYRNKSRNDNNWTTFLAKAIDPTAATTIFSGQAIGIGNEKYNPNYVNAIDNLRIETKSRKKSVFGIGGRNQQTQDLREWARANFDGAELFDADNFINIELAQAIIDSYGDKLQGNTKETLERLIELKEEYEEYEKSLKEYVNQLYSPLLDNMTDAIWQWYDNGKDALAGFKKDASGTFRAIVDDMLKQIVLSQVVGTFQDDIKKIYDKFNKKEIDQNTLVKMVSDRTKEMAKAYESSVPVLEEIVKASGDTLKDALDIDLKQSDAVSATVGAAQSITEDQANEISGRLTAIQLQGETRIAQGGQIIGLSTQANTILGSMLDLDAIRNTFLSDIYDRLGLMQIQFNASLELIGNNTKNL